MNSEQEKHMWRVCLWSLRVIMILWRFTSLVYIMKDIMTLTAHAQIVNPELAYHVSEVL